MLYIYYKGILNIQFEKMLDTSIYVLTLVIIIGLCVLSLYGRIFYSIFKKEMNYRFINGLWICFPISSNTSYGLEYSHAQMCTYFFYFLGVFTSVICALSHVIVLVEMEENSNLWSCAFYTLWLLSLLVFPSFVVLGPSFYWATLAGLSLGSMSSFGIFVSDFHVWGSSDWRSWIFFPIFLHGTIFDLFFWAYSYEYIDESKLNKVELEQLDPESNADEQKKSAKQPGVFTVEEEVDAT
jgi:hypothetical protein